MDECSFPFGGEHFAFLLVNTHVGIQAQTQQRHNLTHSQNIDYWDTGKN